MAKGTGETRCWEQWTRGHGWVAGPGAHGQELVYLIGVRKGPRAEGEWKGCLQSRWEKNV